MFITDRGKRVMTGKDERIIGQLRKTLERFAHLRIIATLEIRTPDRASEERIA